MQRHSAHLLVRAFRCVALLPRIAVDNLITAVFEALDLAAEGHVADGYEMLQIGKGKALEGEANFELTAEAVEALWDGAIRRYARRGGGGARATLWTMITAKQIVASGSVSGAPLY